MTFLFVLLYILVYSCCSSYSISVIYLILSHFSQLAIEQAGLMDKFRERARPEGQDLRILDKNDQV